MKQERANEIAKNLDAIVKNLNSIKEEELEEFISATRLKSAIGPVRVASELLRFKRIVKGIGAFT